MPRTRFARVNYGAVCTEFGTGSCPEGKIIKPTEVAVEVWPRRAKETGPVDIDGQNVKYRSESSTIRISMSVVTHILICPYLYNSTHCILIVRLHYGYNMTKINTCNFF